MSGNDRFSETIASPPDMAEVEALSNDLRKLLVRSEKELISGDVREQVRKLEGWVESYRRGLAAAEKISGSGMDMLQKTHDQLALSLEELLRLEDEGGNPANREQSEQLEKLTSAIRRIDQLMPAVDQSFQCTSTGTSAQLKSA